MNTIQKRNSGPKNRSVDVAGVIKSRLRLQSVIKELELLGVETPEKLVYKNYLKLQYQSFATVNSKEKFLNAIGGPTNRRFTKQFVENL